MVSETSVLNFHKVHSGLGLELVIILKFSARLESPGGTMKHTSAIAPFRDSFMVRLWWDYAWRFFKCSPGKSNVHPGVSTHGSLLLWKVPWIKSQEPEVQAPKPKSNAWACYMPIFELYLLNLLIPSSGKELVLCPIDRRCRVCELILITCSLFFCIQSFERVHQIFTKIHTSQVVKGHCHKMLGVTRNSWSESMKYSTVMKCFAP